MSAICGANCSECGMKDTCKGCSETQGHPFGGSCIAAKCYEKGGKEVFDDCKKQIITEFHELHIPEMPEVKELFSLCGVYVNLEYTLPNGEKIKFLDDKNIYLGTQLEKSNSDRCFGLIAGDDFLLVCEYGCNGADPELVRYQKR